MRYFSPAKLNLFLGVLGKRPDGFHDLASLFQAIDWGDWIDIELSDQDTFTSNCDHLPFNEHHLVIKALSLFRQRTGWKGGCTLHLEKNIPMQAGLGGGNSNAATMLWALNELTQSHIPLSVLKEWSCCLQSDTTFFLSEGTAFCEGKGDILTECSLPQRTLYVSKPCFGLGTPQVFSRFEKQDGSSLEKAVSAWQSWKEGKCVGYNDLEPAACRASYEWSCLSSALKSHGVEYVMSGSGSSFYSFTPLPEQILTSFQVVTSEVSFLNRDSKNWYQPYKHYECNKNYPRDLGVSKC